MSTLLTNGTLSTILQPAVSTTTFSAGQGMSGPPGPPGAPATNYLTYQAAVPLSGHRVLRAIGNGAVTYADSKMPWQGNTAIGLSVNAAAAGDPVNVQYAGQLEEPSWAWVPGLPLFCGEDGMLTQTAPTTGFQLVVAVAASPTAVIVGIKLPILV